MISILIIIILFLLVILAIIWVPYLRSLLMAAEPLAPMNVRDETNIRLYHEHKAEIEQDYALQKIDQESYQYLLVELDNSLLQEIEAEQQASAAASSVVPAKLSIVWPIMLSGLVLAFSVLSYQKLGAYRQLAELASPAASGQSPHAATAVNEETNEAKLLAKLAQLKQQLSNDNNNADVWYEYGKSLVLQGNFSEAAKAFDQVIAIEGEQADLFGAKAQALYYGNNQQITDEVAELMDKALALDPLDPSTNVLLGMDNFINQRYQQAVQYWQRVLDSGRENVNTQALTGAIAEAKNRLSLTGQQIANTDTEKVSDNPELLVELSIAENIKAELQDAAEMVVFIYAIPVTGQRMPVAALKMHVKDLPSTVMLNNARAMSAEHNLSSVNAVNIYAVISKNGNAGIKSGDYKGTLTGVDVSHKPPLALVIDQLVP